MDLKLFLFFSPLLFHGLSFVVVMKLMACGQRLNEKNGVSLKIYANGH